jgi:diguanylate cyclase (GGDEF)-like protein
VNLNPKDLNALEAQVVTDDLTGLYNRRYLNLRLQQEIERSQKRGVSFCLAMLDLDHFKDVNDTYGHSEGDQALLWFANILRQSVRARDILIRFAGDEFFLILPETSLNEAMTVANRVLNTLTSNPFKGTRNQVHVHVGTSCGMAIFPDDAVTVDDLIQSADKGLYLAKEKGRGIICLASEAKKIQQKTISPSLILQLPFVGRENELKELKKSLHNMRETKQGILFLLQGDAGIGKTRLLTELRREIEEGYFLFHVQCRPHEVDIPFQPLIDILIQCIEKDKKYFLQLLAELSKKEQREIMKLLPDMDLPLQEFFKDKEMEPEGISYLYYGITNLLKRLCQSKSLIFLIEDVHWIDTSSAEFLSHFIAQSTSLPVALILSFTSLKEKQVSPEIHKWIRHLQRTASPIEMILPPLKNEAIRKLFYKLFQTENMEDSVEIEYALTEQSEGNPLFIKEILFKMIHEHILVPTTAGWIFDKTKSLTLPEKIKDLILEQIEKLSEELKNLLQIASIIGNEFSFDLVKSLSEKNEGYLLDLIDQALTHGIIEEIPDSKAEKYKFTSPNVRTVLSLQLSLTRTRRLHQKIIEILETISSLTASENPELLFYHSLEGKMADKAFRYGVESAVNAFHKHAVREAKSFFEQIFPLYQQMEVPSQKQLVSLYHRALFCYGEVLTRMGKYKEALLIFTLLPEAPLSKQALGEVHFKLGHYPESLSLLEQSCKETADPFLKSRIESQISDIYYHEGHYSEAEEHGKHAWHWAEKSQRPNARALSFKAIGNACFSRDRFQEALQYYKKSLQQYRLEEDLSGIASCYNNIALIYYRQKKYRLAEKGFLNAKSFSEAIGDNSLTLHILNNLGNVYYDMDLVKQAEQYYSQCLRLSEETGETSITIAACSNLGNLYLVTEQEKAQLHYKKALDLCRKLGEVSKEAQFLSLLGDLHYQKKDFQDSESYYQQSISLRQKLGEFENELYTRMNLLGIYEQYGEKDKLGTLLRETGKRIASVPSLQNKAIKKEWDEIRNRNSSVFI